MVLLRAIRAISPTILAVGPARLAVYTLKSTLLAHLFWTHGYACSSAMGPSMLPTFDIMGEWLLVDKIHHRRGKDIHVGDLVTYSIPVERHSNGIKRVIGMPGDYVLLSSPESGSDKMMQVPPGHCWIVGDNLPASRDSRHFGPIPLALIHGRVIAKFHNPFNPFNWHWFESPLRKLDA